MKRLAYLLALAVPLAVSAQVNWEGQVLQATGSGAPDMKATSPAQARLGAERAAQMDALRNLLAQAKGIRISSNRTVGDEMASDEIRGRVEGLIKSYKVTAKRYFSDNGVEIDVAVPLAALADAFTAPGEKKIPLKTDGEPKNTGLVVDASGLELQPALAPRLVDESGKPLYGAGALSDAKLRERGVAVYVKGMAAARKHDRAGAHPLVVKAARAQGTDLVISAEDAKKLSDSNNAFLAEGRVVIVTRQGR